MGKDQELIEAARSGNLPMLEKILSQRTKKTGPLSSLRRGKDANVQDSSGYSPLHHAALNNQKEAVQCLLDHEASTNIVDVQGSSPLHLAAWTGNVDVVRLIICHGPSVPNVNLKNKNNETAMHCAAQYGHTSVVSLLVNNACDAAVKNNRDETALDLAAQYGRLETVKLLLRHHPDLIQPYSKDYGRILVFPHSPLHLASRNGHKAVVKELLSAGVDVNIRTVQGSALHEAALCGKVEVARCLLENGVDVNIRDQRQQTVMDILQQVKTSVTQEMQNIIQSFHPNIAHPDRQNANRNSSTDPSSCHSDTIPIKNRITRGEDGKRISDGTEAAHEDYGYGRSPRDGNLHPGETDGMSLSSSTGTFPPSSPRDQYLSTSAESQHRQHHKHSHSHSYSQSQQSSTDMHYTTIPRIQENSVSPQDIYIPMGGTLKDGRAPPLPPRKPPRRSLSVSPTHHPGAEEYREKYEFLYLAQSGGACVTGACKGRCRCSSQYVDMKLRDSGSNFYENFTYSGPPFRPSEKRSSKLSPKENGYRKAASCDSYDVDYENLDAITAGTGTYSRHSDIYLDAEDGPASPTHYDQPPTPDHPPPSPIQAEKSIYERIMPLAQEPKRKSRYIETETDDLSDTGDTCSFSSCLSLSDKSSGENFDDIYQDIGDQIVKSESFELQRTDVGRWLASIGVPGYEQKMINIGYEDLQFICGYLDSDDLRSIGMTDKRLRKTVLHACRLLKEDNCESDDPDRPEPVQCIPDNLEVWLKQLKLECYIETFQKHLYSDMDKVAGMLDDELTNVLDITKIGHRKRILHSLNRPLTRNANGDCDINDVDGHKPKHRKSRPPPPPVNRDDEDNEKVDLPLRLPAELMTGLPTVVGTAWRHLPEILLQKSVHYITMYLGSTKASEANFGEVTKKCVQQLKSSPARENEVMISISSKAVLLLDTRSKKLLCEHSITDIHCACQDSDDLSYFAYIVKDESKTQFSCHVFHAESMDRATEITLTLGQAFEVAYQVAVLSACPSSKRSTPGHSRSQSANPTTLALPRKAGNHTRSQSTNEIKSGTLMSSEDKSGSVNNIVLRRAPLARNEDEVGDEV